MNLLDPAPTRFDWNFRLLSTYVRVSGWFWILPGLIGVACASFLGPACYFVVIACFFLSILLHEFGHVLAGRRFGADSYIVLNGVGGAAVGCAEVGESWQRVVVFLAGPFAQLLVGVPLWLTFDRIIPSLNPEWFCYRPLHLGLMALMGINVSWPLFNLLPIWPLDGWHVCNELLGHLRGWSRPPWERDANWWKQGAYTSSGQSYHPLTDGHPGRSHWTVVLVVTLAIGLPAGWLAWDCYKSWQRWEAYAELEKIGAVADGYGPHACYGFNFRGTKVDEEHLALLEAFDRLDEVDLAGTRVTDTGLRHLEGFHGLKMLYLQNTSVTDIGLSHVEGLTELEVLHLSGTRITDIGLLHLRPMRKLEWLSLSHTRITDAGLSEIKNLPGLKYLHVYDSQVTEEGVAELKKSVPSLVVNPTEEEHDDGCHYPSRADMKPRIDERSPHAAGNEHP